MLGTSAPARDQRVCRGLSRGWDGGESLQAKEGDLYLCLAHVTG